MSTILAAEIVLATEHADGSLVIRQRVASHDAMLLYQTLAGWFGVTGKPGHPANVWPPFGPTDRVYVWRGEAASERARVEIRIPDAVPNAARPNVPDTFRKPRPCVMGVDLLAYLGAPDATFKARGRHHVEAPRKPRAKPLDDATAMACVAAAFRVIAKELGKELGPDMRLLPADPCARPIAAWPEIRRWTRRKADASRLPSTDVPLEPANSDGYTWPAYVEAAGYGGNLLARLDKDAADLVFDSWKACEDPDVYVQAQKEIAALREKRGEKRRKKERKVALTKIPLGVSLAVLCASRGVFSTPTLLPTERPEELRSGAFPVTFSALPADYFTRANRDE